MACYGLASFPRLAEKRQVTGHSSCLPTSQPLLRDRLRSCLRQDINKAFDSPSFLRRWNGTLSVVLRNCQITPQDMFRAIAGQKIRILAGGTPSSPAVFALHVVLAPTQNRETCLASPRLQWPEAREALTCSLQSGFAARRQPGSAVCRGISASWWPGLGLMQK